MTETEGDESTQVGSSNADIAATEGSGEQEQEGGEVVPAEGGEVQEGGNGQNDGNNTRQPTAGESFIAITKSLVIRALMIYFIVSFFRRPQTPPTGQPGQPGASTDSLGRMPAVNSFENGTVMSLYAYISESEHFMNFKDPGALVWFQEDLVYGDWTSGPEEDGIWDHSVTIPTSERLRNNGSIYLHIYIVKQGYSPDPTSDHSYQKKYTIYQSRILNKYKRRRYRKTSNLITGETKLTEEEILKAETVNEEIVSHWHPNITINIVHDFTQWTRGAVPPPFDEYLEFSPLGDKYTPIVFLNTYWNLVKDYKVINTTTESLPLKLTFQPITLFKWQLYAAQAMKNRYEDFHLLEDRQDREDDVCGFETVACSEGAEGSGVEERKREMTVDWEENECPAVELFEEFDDWIAEAVQRNKPLEAECEKIDNVLESEDDFSEFEEDDPASRRPYINISEFDQDDFEKL